MARQATSMKKTRTRYSQAYKDEALALADRVGASAAASNDRLDRCPSVLGKITAFLEARGSTIQSGGYSPA